VTPVRSVSVPSIAPAAGGASGASGAGGAGAASALPRPAVAAGIQKPSVHYAYRGSFTGNTLPQTREHKHPVRFGSMTLPAALPQKGRADDIPIEKRYDIVSMESESDNSDDNDDDDDDDLDD
jgi:hypothetical protein